MIFGSPEGNPLDPEFEERLGTTTSQLNEAASTLGLYLQSLSVRVPEDDPSEHMILMADFIIGDLAFSEQTLYPKRFEENEKTREMFADSGLDDPAQNIRDQWKGLLDGE